MSNQLWFQKIERISKYPKKDYSWDINFCPRVKPLINIFFKKHQIYKYWHEVLTLRKKLTIYAKKFRVILEFDKIIIINNKQRKITLSFQRFLKEDER